MRYGCAREIAGSPYSAFVQIKDPRLDKYFIMPKPKPPYLLGRSNSTLDIGWFPIVGYELFGQSVFYEIFMAQFPKVPEHPWLKVAMTYDGNASWPVCGPGPTLVQVPECSNPRKCLLGYDSPGVWIDNPDSHCEWHVHDMFQPTNGSSTELTSTRSLTPGTCYIFRTKTSTDGGYQSKFSDETVFCTSGLPPAVHVPFIVEPPPPPVGIC